MGRGRGKGKKSTIGNRDDGSGEEEKIPVQKRRGRPQKSVKNGINDEEEVDKIEEEIGESVKIEETAFEEVLCENGAKRKRFSQADTVKEESGFRHNISRRKSKPRRAAEAVVECNCMLN